MPDLSPSGVPVWRYDESPNLAVITQSQADALDPIVIPAFATAAARAAAFPNPTTGQLSYRADEHVYERRIAGSWVPAWLSFKNRTAPVFGTNAAEIYVQSDTQLVTTTDTGRALIILPQPFENSIISIKPTLMDSSTAIAVKTVNVPTSLGTFTVQAFDTSGPAANIGIRVSYDAVGS